MKKLILFLLVIVGFSCDLSAQSGVYLDLDSLIKTDLSKKVGEASEVKYTIEKRIDSLSVVDPIFIEGVKRNLLLDKKYSDSLCVVSFNKYKPFEMIFTPSQYHFDYIIGEKILSGFFVIDEVYFYVEKDYPKEILSPTSIKKEFALQRTIYVGNANQIPPLLYPHYDPISWICTYRDKEFILIEKSVL